MRDDLAKKFMAATSHYFYLTKIILQHTDNIICCITICMGCIGIVCVPHDGTLFFLHNSISYTRITWVNFKIMFNKGVGEEVAPQQHHLCGATQRFVQEEIESFMISLFDNLIQITFINQAHHFDFLVCKFDYCEIILFRMDVRSFDVGGGGFLSFDGCR